jgi:hypothetical protein
MYSEADGGKEKPEGVQGKPRCPPNGVEEMRAGLPKNKAEQVQGDCESQPDQCDCGHVFLMGDLVSLRPIWNRATRLAFVKGPNRPLTGVAACVTQ